MQGMAIEPLHAMWQTRLVLQVPSLGAGTRLIIKKDYGFWGQIQ